MGRIPLPERRVGLCSAYCNQDIRARGLSSRVNLLPSLTCEAALATLSPYVEVEVREMLSTATRAVCKEWESSTELHQGAQSKKCECGLKYGSSPIWEATLRRTDCRDRFFHMNPYPNRNYSFLRSYKSGRKAGLKQKILPHRDDVRKVVVARP